MRQNRKLKGSGELRHMIEIQSFTAATNDFGEVVKEWVPFKNTWAKILPKSSKEFLSGDKETSQITHRIVIRYIDGILPNMRVRFGERIFDIHAPLNHEERNEYLQMLCKEIVL